MSREKFIPPYPVVVKGFAFNNERGGTAFSNGGPVGKLAPSKQDWAVLATERFFDEETGWRFIGTAIGESAKRRLVEENNPNSPVYFSEFDVVSPLTKAAITADDIEDRHQIAPIAGQKPFKPGVMLLLQPGSPETIPYFMTHDEIKQFWPKVEEELVEFTGLNVLYLQEQSESGIDFEGMLQFLGIEDFEDELETLSMVSLRGYDLSGLVPPGAGSSSGRFGCHSRPRSGRANTMTTEVDVSKIPMGYTRDAENRVISVREANGFWLLNTFDPDGYGGSYRDSNGEWNKLVYDAATRTFTETYSTGTTNVTKFNEAGLPIDARSSAGIWIESTYNKDGYLLTERNSHGQIVNKTYDEQNNELTSSISYFDVDEEEGLTP
jgi:hypothetical protein